MLTTGRITFFKRMIPNESLGTRNRLRSGLPAAPGGVEPVGVRQVGLVPGDVARRAAVGGREAAGQAEPGLHLPPVVTCVEHACQNDQIRCRLWPPKNGRSSSHHSRVAAASCGRRPRTRVKYRSMYAETEGASPRGRRASTGGSENSIRCKIMEGTVDSADSGVLPSGINTMGPEPAGSIPPNP